jgi:hypothetical protein
MWFRSITIVRRIVRFAEFEALPCLCRYQGKRSQGKHIEIIKLKLQEKWGGKIAFCKNLLKYFIFFCNPVCCILFCYSSKFNDFSRFTLCALTYQDAATASKAS